MPPISRSTNRRSQRLLRGMPVIVCGESLNRKPFREEGLTVEFNAHGALLILYEKVERGQKVLLLNPTTWDEQEARVVHSVPFHDGLSYVGIEFTKPSVEFWPVIAPKDWTNATVDSSARRGQVA